MDISLFRSRIVIQKSEPQVDSIGNRRTVWKDYYPCYAYANIATGKTAGEEYESAGQTVATDGYTFIVRYCTALKDMDSEHFRIVFQGDIYNITLVDDYQFRHQTLKLTARKVQR